MNTTNYGDFKHSLDRGISIDDDGPDSEDCPVEKTYWGQYRNLLTGGFISEETYEEMLWEWKHRGDTSDNEPSEDWE